MSDESQRALREEKIITESHFNKLSSARIAEKLGNRTVNWVN